MKRVIMFGGCNHRPARDLNLFLTKHQDFELLDIRPMQHWDNNIMLFCTVNVPDDVGGQSERDYEYLGFQGELEETE